MEVKNIIHGHINELFNLNNEISKKRLNICYSCPLYSPKLGGICNNKLWLNVNTGDVSTIKKDGYVNGCRCKLFQKTRMSASTCPANKW